jgi:hypothetical protein
MVLVVLPLRLACRNPEVPRIVVQFNFKDVVLRLDDLILGCMGTVFLSSFRSPSAWVFLNPWSRHRYVAPGLLMRLSPGEDMIPDEGIMACPYWIEAIDNLARVHATHVWALIVVVIYAHGL